MWPLTFLFSVFQYMAGILGVLLFFWFKAVNSLGVKFESAMEAGDEVA